MKAVTSCNVLPLMSAKPARFERSGQLAGRSPRYLSTLRFVEMPGGIYRHQRNALTYRERQARPLADELLGYRIIAERALGDWADQEFQ